MSTKTIVVMESNKAYIEEKLKRAIKKSRTLASWGAFADIEAYDRTKRDIGNLLNKISSELPHKPFVEIVVDDVFDVLKVY